MNILEKIEPYCEARKQEILQSKDLCVVSGQCYYVSEGGNDQNSGTSPDAPWKTLQKVSSADLQPGDGVFFRRGELFRGFVETKPGITYAAYGSGEKPRFYGWDHSLADPALWEPAAERPKIWKLKNPILDCGTLVFNGGERHSRKLIPSYIRGRFVCREAEDKPFRPETEMTQNLDIVCFYEGEMDTRPSHGEDFPVPKINDKSFGTLYLRCDEGNPGTVFREIEALPRRHMFYIRKNQQVTLDNLCIRYVGAHGIQGSGDSIRGLTVTNCELGWIGGGIQNYIGNDPNYPQGGRGTVTRFGNAIEIYGGCADFRVENCYIYQVYDAAITHQAETKGRFLKMEHIRYLNNLVEYTVYPIEYFLIRSRGDTQSYMADIEISGNILRHTGYGWGQQRHNAHTPAHLKGWSFENPARDFRIHHNLLDRSAYRMLHLVAKEPESCPTLWENTYVQHQGGLLGQYGANQQAEPPVLPFDERAKETLQTVYGEQNPTVHLI